MSKDKKQKNDNNQNVKSTRKSSSNRVANSNLTRLFFYASFCLNQLLISIILEQENKHLSIETCEFFGNRQGNRNKHRHQHSCSKNPKSSKFLNRIIFLIQNLVELTKNDNSDVRTNDVMLEIITNDH